MIYLDNLNRDCSLLTNKKLYLLDLDGTVNIEDRLIEGVFEWFQEVIKLNRNYIFITNNSSKSIDSYIEKLHCLGIPVVGNNFCTSVKTAVNYLKKHFPNQLIYVQGTISMIKELRKNGINVTTEFNEKSNIVLVGFDTELTSEKLYNTCKMLTHSKYFIATNPDLKCPVEFGYIPDCGAICDMIYKATGRTPIFLGKPKKEIIETAMGIFHNTPNDTVVIGDRLYTDIASGINAKVSTICVLTGETTIKEIEKETSYKPDYVFDSVGCIPLI